jgi:hypothetical protein
MTSLFQLIGLLTFGVAFGYGAYRLSIWLEKHDLG